MFIQVLESCVKNCGSLIHDEIATKQYMEQLKELVKTSPHENVRQRTLGLIEAWAHAFRHSPKYRTVQVINYCYNLIICNFICPLYLSNIYFSGHITYNESRRLSLSCFERK